ncbi:cupin domain-containing protein [Cedecea sp.]|jgi:quercetin dioxygenase-like cupin family protein|uniref:cupin domain-containing protein n=1 Tax=Cedecea sp. TaxID=1970739 RepID=UPI0012ADD700|nr:cupin domain-containing protein [Enterobacteriaceae bacterium RIT693]
MIVSKENAEHYLWGGGCDGWHLLKDPALSVIHERMPAGRAEQRHYHSTAQQFFFVLFGELTMVLEGQCYVVSSGKGIPIPPQVKHQARNDSGNEVEFLVISQPMTRGDRVNLE